MQQSLPESSVTLDRVFSILKAAYLKPEPESSTEITVRLENCKAFVGVDSEKKLINMYCIFRMRENSTIHERLALMNRLNQNVVICRFYTVGANDHILCSDYALRYEEGLIPFHLIGALKWLNGITVGAIKNYDERNLVE